MVFRYDLNVFTTYNLLTILCFTQCYYIMGLDVDGTGSIHELARYLTNVSFLIDFYLCFHNLWKIFVFALILSYF